MTLHSTPPTRPASDSCGWICCGPTSKGVADSASSLTMPCFERWRPEIWECSGFWIMGIRSTEVVLLAPNRTLLHSGVLRRPQQPTSEATMFDTKSGTSPTRPRLGRLFRMLPNTQPSFGKASQQSEGPMHQLQYQVVASPDSIWRF